MLSQILSNMQSAQTSLLRLLEPSHTRPMDYRTMRLVSPQPLSLSSSKEKTPIRTLDEKEIPTSLEFAKINVSFRTAQGHPRLPFFITLFGCLWAQIKTLLFKILSLVGLAHGTPLLPVYSSSSYQQEGYRPPPPSPNMAGRSWGGWASDLEVVEPLALGNEAVNDDGSFTIDGVTNYPGVSRSLTRDARPWGPASEIRLQVPLDFEGVNDGPVTIDGITYYPAELPSLLNKDEKPSDPAADIRRAVLFSSEDVNDVLTMPGSSSEGMTIDGVTYFPGALCSCSNVAEQPWDPAAEIRSLLSLENEDGLGDGILTYFPGWVPPFSNRVEQPWSPSADIRSAPLLEDGGPDGRYTHFLGVLPAPRG